MKSKRRYRFFAFSRGFESRLILDPFFLFALAPCLLLPLSPIHNYVDSVRVAVVHLSAYSHPRSASASSLKAHKALQSATLRLHLKLTTRAEDFKVASLQ